MLRGHPVTTPNNAPVRTGGKPDAAKSVSVIVSVDATKVVATAIALCDSVTESVDVRPVTEVSASVAWSVETKKRVVSEYLAPVFAVVVIAIYALRARLPQKMWQLLDLVSGGFRLENIECRLLTL
jgi:hypothetical protein